MQVTGAQNVYKSKCRILRIVLLEVAIEVDIRRAQEIECNLFIPFFHKNPSRRVNRFGPDDSLAFLRIPESRIEESLHGYALPMTLKSVLDRTDRGVFEMLPEGPACPTAISVEL